MGMFDFLFGITKQRKKIEIVPDFIWMTSEAKFTGLAKAAEQRAMSESVAIILVAHFPDVLARLDHIVSQQTWDVPSMSVLASDLSAQLANNLGIDDTATIDIIVAERHPLPASDDRLLDFSTSQRKSPAVAGSRITSRSMIRSSRFLRQIGSRVCSNSSA